MERHDVTITLYMSELIFDVENKTYLTGRSRQTGENHEEVANMQANDDDENLSQVQRSIQNAYATLKTKLSEYLSSNQSIGNNDLIGDDEEELRVSLKMPTNYNHATVDTITAALHQYIVNMAISDWFTITNKTDAGDYVALATTNLELVRESLNKRVRPTRRPAGDNSGRFEPGVQTVETPTISRGMTSADKNNVTISCATNGAAIYYTMGGGTPTTDSTLYSGAIELANGTSTTFSAIAVKSGMNDSAVARATFSYDAS